MFIHLLPVATYTMFINLLPGATYTMFINLLPGATYTMFIHLLPGATYTMFIHLIICCHTQFLSTYYLPKFLCTLNRNWSISKHSKQFSCSSFGLNCEVKYYVIYISGHPLHPSGNFFHLCTGVYCVDVRRKTPMFLLRLIATNVGAM